MGSTIPQGKNYLPLFSQSSNLGEFFFPCISKSETVCSPPNFDNTVLDRALATPFCISLVKYVGRRFYSFSPSPSLYPRVRVLSPKILFSPTLAAKIPPFCLLARDREIRQGVREGVKTTLGWNLLRSLSSNLFSMLWEWERFKQCGGKSAFPRLSFLKPLDMPNTFTMLQPIMVVERKEVNQPYFSKKLSQELCESERSTIVQLHNGTISTCRGVWWMLDFFENKERMMTSIMVSYSSLLIRESVVLLVLISSTFDPSDFLHLVMAPIIAWKGCDTAPFLILQCVRNFRVLKAEYLMK